MELVPTPTRPRRRRFQTCLLREGVVATSIARSIKPHNRAGTPGGYADSTDAAT